MLSLGEINQLMKKLKEWGLEGNAIDKTFSFKDFSESLKFLNKVGEVAEAMNHYPSIQLNRDKVRLILTTLEDGGLSVKDFDVAEAIDRIDLRSLE